MDASPDVANDAACDGGQSDPNNCGFCGHSCNGATCSGGYCDDQPISVGIEGTETVACFTIDATSIYYSFTSNTGQVEVDKIPKAGGTPTLLAANESGCPMVVVGSNVYWMSDQTTMHFTSTAGGGPVTTGATLPRANVMYHITTDGTDVYFVDATGNVNKTPLAGGPATNLSGIVDDGGLAGASHSITAIDATTVYWFDDYDLKRVPLGGGTPVLLYQLDSHYGARGLAVDAAGIYELDTNSGHVINLAGGNQRGFIGAPYPGDLVVDSTNGYVCYGYGFGFQSLDDPTGQPVQLSTPSLNADPNPLPDHCGAGFAVDDAWLYYAGVGEARIHRIAK